MNFLNTWLQGIIVCVIIVTIIELILPSGSTKKYIKVVLGMFILFNIITPVINKITKNNFEISSIINMDEYSKKMKTYETSSQNQVSSNANEQTIKQIYISKLEKDIKNKLKEKNYTVSKIKIEINENEEYSIKQINLLVQKNEEETEKKQENAIEIENIETINIQVNENIIPEQKEENISVNEISKIKQYLASEYQINEKQININ